MVKISKKLIYVELCSCLANPSVVGTPSLTIATKNLAGKSLWEIDFGDIILEKGDNVKVMFPSDRF